MKAAKVIGLTAAILGLSLAPLSAPMTGEAAPSARPSSTAASSQEPAPWALRRRSWVISAGSCAPYSASTGQPICGVRSGAGAVP